jgi:hypothetical protein
MIPNRLVAGMATIIPFIGGAHSNYFDDYVHIYI